VVLRISGSRVSFATCSALGRRCLGWFVLGGLVVTGCSGDRSGAEIDDLLLAPAAIGPGFERASFRPASRPEACEIGILADPAATDSAGMAAVSDTAQERVTEEVLEFAGAEAASGVFLSVASSANCRSEGNLAPGGGGREDVEIVGADEAFAVDYTNQNDSVGLVVARVGSFVAIFSVEFHQGETTSAGLGSLAVAELAVALLREEADAP